MFVGRNLLCKVTDFGFFSNNCHLCVEIFTLDIRIQKWQLLFDSTKTYIFFDFFLATKKDCILHSYLCIVKTKIVKVEDISPNLLGCFAEITAYLV